MTEPTEAEETRLRRAFTLIGDEAGHPDPAPTVGLVTPARTQRARRRARRALAVTAAACAAAGVAVALAVGTGGDGAESPADATGRGQTLPEALACAEAVVEGEVTSVRPAGRDRVLLTMAVDRWFKPDTGPDTTQFDLADPGATDPQDAYETGEHVLLFVPRKPDATADPFRGRTRESVRDQIIQAMPKVQGTTCPEEFR
ncbi:hypothetical protein GCM10010400_64450 [Streptomyces aculeolatus]|uniref:hypothetical protein n=1 Tax=Streptomyces aculeolatus TaxID=270689 RepID=UPI001CED2622|nr:hypothetical protein [Streptomyces aculeolatus]